MQFANEGAGTYELSQNEPEQSQIWYNMFFLKLRMHICVQIQAWQIEVHQQMHK